MLKGVRRAALPACPETGCCYYLGSLLRGALIGATHHARRYAPGHASLSASVAEASEVSRAAARLLRNPHPHFLQLTASGSWPLAPWFLDDSGC